MFFTPFDKAELSAAFARFKLVGTIFGALLLLMMLISVFYREFFNDVPLATMMVMVLIVWFYLDENISKSKVLYGCAWGVEIAFVLILFMMESELGLSIFSMRQLLPLFVSLISLLGVAYFSKFKMLRYGVLILLLFMVIKLSFFMG